MNPLLVVTPLPIIVGLAAVGVGVVLLAVFATVACAQVDAALRYETGLDRARGAL